MSTKFLVTPQFPSERKSETVQSQSRTRDTRLLRLSPCASAQRRMASPLASVIVHVACVRGSFGDGDDAMMRTSPASERAPNSGGTRRRGYLVHHRDLPRRVASPCRCVERAGVSPPPFAFGPLGRSSEGRQATSSERFPKVLRAAIHS